MQADAESEADGKRRTVRSRSTGDLIDLFSKNRKLTARPLASQREGGERLDDAHVRHDRSARQERPARPRLRVGHDEPRARRCRRRQNMIADSLDVYHAGAARAARSRAPHARSPQGKPDTTRSRSSSPTRPIGSAATRSSRTSTRPRVASATRPSRRASSSSSPRGHASSLYHVAPSDTTEHAPAINYVTARRITIDFNDSSESRDRDDRRFRRGVYIEPRADTRRGAGRRRLRRKPARRRERPRPASEAAADHTDRAGVRPANSRTSVTVPP